MKRFFILFSVLLLAASPVCADMAKEEAIAQFVQGNLSYKEGDYKRAIEKYEGILQGNRGSAALHFNLANAYYREGDLARAILNYERSKRLAPRDGDIDFNYKYTRSKANFFEGTIGNGSLLQKLIEEHISFYSADEMMKMICLLLWMMAAVHLLSLYRRWQLRPRQIFLGIFFVGICIFAGWMIIKLRLQADQAIVLMKADAKFEPKEESTTHYSLLEGAQVKILKEDGPWVKIERPDGKQGWLPKEDLEKI